MKKLLKLLGILLTLIILAGVIFGMVLNEPLPEGKKGIEADALAKKMLAALNHEKLLNTGILEWSFRDGAHTYVWNKKTNKCTVRWNDHEVILDLKNPKKSQVKKNGKPVKANTEKTIKKAQDLFNNDSFWLVAPYKVFDAGTERSLATLEDGAQALLITYTTGGTTPGDSYLWLLNENGFPQSYKMWVKILPIGGLEATWDDWIVTESGAFLPKSHKLGPITLHMGNVKGYHE